MGILFWIIIFIISIAVLVKSSDYFTEIAEKIGLSLGLPPFIVGVTIVAIGTSLPELISSIISVFEKSSEIVIGNVIGSNVTNIFLILGFAAIIAKKKIHIEFELIHTDLPLFIGSAFFLALTILDGKFTVYEGILALLLLIVYLIYTFKSGTDNEIKKELKDFKKEKFKWVNVLLLVISAIFIFIGAKYTVESVINLSKLLKIGTEIIAITAVALGTSLPELAVTFSAAKKGKGEIAVGNILGSNIFNALAVMAIPAIIETLVIPTSILTFGLPVMLAATLLYFFITQDREITKWEGWMLIVFYILFVGKSFGII